MSDLANLTVKLEAQTAAFERGMDNASKSIARMDKRFSKTQRAAQKFAKVMASAFAAKAVINGVKAIASNAINLGDSLSKLNVRLGVSVEFLSTLRYAAESSGVGFETATMALQRMSRRLGQLAETGGGEALAALDGLNIAFEDIQNLKPEEQFKVLADAIADVEDPQKKLFIAMKLFDSEGVKMVQMLKDGSKGMSDYEKKAKSLGIVMTTQMAKGFEDAKQAGTDLSFAIEGVGIALTNAFGSILSQAMQNLAIFVQDMRLTFSLLDTLGAKAATLKNSAEKYQTTWDKMGSAGVPGVSKITEGIKATRKELSIARNEVKAFQHTYDTLQSAGVGTSGIEKQMEASRQKIVAAKNELIGLNAERDKLETGWKKGGATEPEIIIPEVITGGGKGGKGGGSAAIDATTQSVEQMKAAILSLNESLNPSVAAMNEFQQNAALLKSGLDAGILSMEEYTSLIGQLGDRLKEAGDEAGKWSDIMNSAISDFASGMADTLVDSIMSADASFQDFIKNFLAGIAKAIIQAQILAAITSVTGAMGFGGSPAPAAKGLSLAPAGITPFGTGTIAPHLYDVAPIKPAAKSTGEVSIQVNNYADATVKTTSQKDDAGNVNISLMIENTVKAGMSSGRFDSVMQGNWGARRQPS